MSTQNWSNQPITSFGFYCQHVLPLVYDESLSYYETLCKLQAKLNEVIKTQNDLQDAFQSLLDWVNTQLEQYAKDQLNEWLDDGTLESIINETIFNELNAKVDKNKEDIDTLKGVALSIEFFPKETTDISDSERIQRAIDYLHGLNGGTLNFPDGNYEIHTTLIIYENISLHGMSASSTVFNVKGNFSFIKSYDVTSRHDNMELSNFRINREGTDVNTPLIDFDHCSYSRLENLNCYQFNSQQLIDGCVGLHFGSFSYYNTITNCQFRQFHTGILCDGEANGNTFIGGNCAFCGVFGVHIIKTNSQRFFGHAVEGGGDGVTAYKMEQHSLFNSFFGCRVESVGKSYEALFETNSMSSFNNMVFDGLDYSTNGENFTGISNEIINVSNMSSLRNWSTKPAFKLASNSAQSTISAGSTVKINTNSLYYDRASNTTPSSSRFTVPITGMYHFSVGALCATAQSNAVVFSLYVNGTEIMTRTGAKGKGNNYITDFMTLLNINDYVEVYITPTTSTALSSGSLTYFAGSII